MANTIPGWNLPAVADPGEGPAPPYFYTKLWPKGPKNFFLRPVPPPPPPAPLPASASPNTIFRSGSGTDQYWSLRTIYLNRKRTSFAHVNGKQLRTPLTWSESRGLSSTASTKLPSIFPPEKFLLLHIKWRSPQDPCMHCDQRQLCIRAIRLFPPTSNVTGFDRLAPSSKKDIAILGKCRDTILFNLKPSFLFCWYWRKNWYNKKSAL